MNENSKTFAKNFFFPEKLLFLQRFKKAGVLSTLRKTKYSLVAHPDNYREVRAAGRRNKIFPSSSVG
jgi:hypothetical protein